MFEVEFKNRVKLSEFLGDDVSSAEVTIKGDFVPKVAGFRFLDEYSVTDDGTVLYLAQWEAREGEPGFRFWRVDTKRKLVETSERFRGYCIDLYLREGNRLYSGTRRTEIISDFQEAPACTL